MNVQQTVHLRRYTAKNITLLRISKCTLVHRDPTNKKHKMTKIKITKTRFQFQLELQSLKTVKLNPDDKVKKTKLKLQRKMEVQKTSSAAQNHPLTGAMNDA